MINEKTSADTRSGVDLNAGEKAPQMRQRPGQPFQAKHPQRMRQPMQQQRMHARVTGQYLQRVARRRIAFKNTGNVFA